MSYKIIFLLLLCIVICTVTSSHIEEKEQVKVQVFYEAHCLGCIDFYSDSLLKLVEKLGAYVDLQTYPFGNARFVDDAQTIVKCQGGEEECYGNMILACSIDEMKNDTLKYVKYDACVLSKQSTDKAADECGKSQNINSDSIKKCAKGKKGQELLIKYGKETLNANNGNYIKYAPFTLINGKEFGATKNHILFIDVCAAFKTPPEACDVMMNTKL